MNRLIKFLLLSWLLLVPLAHGEITTTDDTGAVVSLRRPVTRIISLSPHITELLFASGAGKLIVGTVDYSDFPKAAKHIRRIGGYNALDLEAITALKPDLIVGWASGNPQVQLDQLRKLGFHIFLSEPRHLLHIADTIEQLGLLAGTEKTALDTAKQFRREYNALHKKYQGRSKVRVFYEVWNHPLMTINGEQIISDIIRECGGENIFAKLPALTPLVSTEAVLQANPEVIIASSENNKRPPLLDEWKRWTALLAVQRDNLFYVPADWISRPTPRILKGMEAVCEILDQARQHANAW